METERKLELTGAEVVKIVYPLLDLGTDGRGNSRKESKLLDPALTLIESHNGKTIESLTLMLSEGAYNLLKARFEGVRLPGSMRGIADGLEKKLDNAEKVEKAGG